MRDRLLLLAATAAIGCIRVPQATVTVSEVVGERITAIRSSHEAFVRLYYQRLRDDAERFVNDVWTPAFLRRAVANAAFRQSLDVSYAVASIQPDDITVTVRGEPTLPEPVRTSLRAAIDTALNSHRARLGVVMLDFAVAAETQIRQRRVSLLDPIDEQERFVLAELSDAYGDLHRAQAAITGFLGSAVRVQREQDVILQKLGVLETQRKLLDLAAKGSEAAAKGLATVGDAEGAITRFLETLRATQDSLAKLRVASPR
jgi:hypothetical protein